MFCTEIKVFVVLGFLCRLTKANDHPLNISYFGDDYEELDEHEFWKEVVDKYNSETTDRHDENAYKIVCYFPNFASYRKPPANLSPKDVDPNLCTHIHYLHVTIDPDTLHLMPSDIFADFDNEFYQEMAELKSNRPHLKVLVTLDGSKSEGKEYSQMLSSDKEREHFIHNTIDFLKEYDFDGIDLMPPLSVDKRELALFIQEMRENFDQEIPRLLISGSFSAKKDVIERVYDVTTIAKCLDYINVMTYDFHGPWESITGFNAPISDVEAGMMLWVRAGVPPRKLILGIPTYGRSFTLNSGGRYDVGTPAVGPGSPGPETADKGFLSYTEIALNIVQNKWKKVSTREGCYAFGGNQWASYDDPQEALRKGQVVTKNKYGGMAVRDLSTDDFVGRVCQSKFPILKAVNQALGKEVTDFFENCP